MEAKLHFHLKKTQETQEITYQEHVTHDITEICHMDSIKQLWIVAEKGHKASHKKLQYCQELRTCQFQRMGSRTIVFRKQRIIILYNIRLRSDLLT